MPTAGGFGGVKLQVYLGQVVQGLEQDLVGQGPVDNNNITKNNNIITINNNNNNNNNSCTQERKKQKRIKQCLNQLFKRKSKTVNNRQKVGKKCLRVFTRCQKVTRRFPKVLERPQVRQQRNKER